MKTLFWIGLLAVGAYFGVRYIQHDPHAVDIQKTQPGVYRPQPAPPAGGNNGGQIVVIP